MEKLLPGVQGLIMLTLKTKERLQVQQNQSTWLRVLVDVKTRWEKSPFSFQRVGGATRLSPVCTEVTKINEAVINTLTLTNERQDKR